MLPAARVLRPGWLTVTDCTAFNRQDLTSLEGQYTAAAAGKPAFQRYDSQTGGGHMQARTASAVDKPTGLLARRSYAM